VAARCSNRSIHFQGQNLHAMAVLGCGIAAAWSPSAATAVLSTLYQVAHCEVLRASLRAMRKVDRAFCQLSGVMNLEGRLHERKHVRRPARHCYQADLAASRVLPQGLLPCTGCFSAVTNTANPQVSVSNTPGVQCAHDRRPRLSKSHTTVDIAGLAS
jgi:hypothetical protein